MKKAIVYISLLMSVLTFSQKKNNILESEGLVGFWQQAVAMKNELTGELTFEYMGNYKVINPDGSFFAFFVIPDKVFRGNRTVPNTIMNVYGTYEMTSDSTFTEHIIHHSSPKYINTNSVLRFKHKDKNTLVQEFKNDNNDWVPEIWKRVLILDSENKKQPKKL